MTARRSTTSYSPGGPVVLATHDLAWAAEFAREAAAIRAAVQDVTVDIQHIGSTAVPGLIAKPVIDILLTVTHLPALDDRSGRLANIGYEARGEFGIPGRRYFHKTGSDGVRTHQIHAFVQGSQTAQRHLDFRDYLRAHPSAAEAYASLKARLAERFGSDVEGYANAKTDFVREIERVAAAWRANMSRTSPRPDTDS